MQPPTHWLVAFFLPFCGSATAYESQTLAAFGEKEPRNRRRSVESINCERFSTVD